MLRYDPIDDGANITVLQVAAGKSSKSNYLEQHSHRMISVLQYCIHRRYSYVLETNNMCVLRMRYAAKLGVTKVGSYMDPICRDPEVRGGPTHEHPLTQFQLQFHFQS